MSFNDNEFNTEQFNQPPTQSIGCASAAGRARTSQGALSVGAVAVTPSAQGRRARVSSPQLLALAVTISTQSARTPQRSGQAALAPQPIALTQAPARASRAQVVTMTIAPQPATLLANVARARGLFSQLTQLIPNPIVLSLNALGVGARHAAQQLAPQPVSLSANAGAITRKQMMTPGAEFRPVAGTIGSASTQHRARVSSGLYLTRNISVSEGVNTRARVSPPQLVQNLSTASLHPFASVAQQQAIPQPVALLHVQIKSTARSAAAQLAAQPVALSPTQQPRRPRQASPAIVVSSVALDAAPLRSPRPRVGSPLFQMGTVSLVPQAAATARRLLSPVIAPQPVALNVLNTSTGTARIDSSAQLHPLTVILSVLVLRARPLVASPGLTPQAITLALSRVGARASLRDAQPIVHPGPITCSVAAGVRSRARLATTELFSLPVTLAPRSAQSRALFDSLRSLRTSGEVAYLYSQTGRGPTTAKVF
jgi:hypothetical protein